MTEWLYTASRRLSVELARDAQVIKLKEQLQEERKRVDKLQKVHVCGAYM